MAFSQRLLSVLVLANRLRQATSSELATSRERACDVVSREVSVGLQIISFKWVESSVVIYVHAEVTYSPNKKKINHLEKSQLGGILNVPPTQ